MKNNRTFLEKLLDGAEVEWKPLWSVTTWDKRFNAVEKEKQPKVIKYHYYLASELKPLIVDGGNVKLLTTNESDIWTTEELVQSNISEGEIIAIPWGGNPIVQYYKGKFVTADNRIATSNNTKILDNKFLYYFLLSKLDVISSFYRGSGIKHPSMYHVLEMLIPIPPHPVQTEIVRILDALTALTSELTSELILRRKQYEYYREKLLSEEELGKVGFEWKTVKSLCNDNFWLMPATPEFDDNGNIPYITSKNIKGGKIDFQNTKYINEYVYQELSRTRCIIENDILISMIGTIGEAVIVKKEDLYFYGQNMYVLRLNNELVNHKFFLYYFTAPFILNSLLSKKNSSNQGYLKAGQIESLKIPIPPLPVQTKIVKILDKFETLTNSITEGLPLAIEQSQKRYEYYRELLLNFS